MPAPTIAEYVWIDGGNPTQALRGKTKVIFDFEPTGEDGPLPTDFPDWSFDGSSTSQAEGDSSDCYLKPAFVVPNPIDQGYIVLCEVFMADGETPHPSNMRAKLRQVLGRALHTVPAEGTREADMWNSWFGLEQEYTLMKGGRPLGFPENGFPAPQGPYYCGVGDDEVVGRDMVMDHLEACLEAGLRLSGVNAEVMPGQWEFQVGPLGPLDVGDQLWLARYLLYRVGEQHGIAATLDPKPAKGDWNGAGMHTNFSTPQMRRKNPSMPGEEVGMLAIESWCLMAGEHIEEHLDAYGDRIEARLTGRHETCSYKDWKWGVSDRTASIRIPLEAAKNGCGYLEDRRPNANACPYRVAEVMIKTAFGLWPR